ncbi:MAG TPA: hypothetical protein VES20_12200 [Bryobacteraceae bacterium]|nr:hypothetical protein [Bryobacteraceae bacterium]
MENVTPPEEASEHQQVLIYIAKKLKEALALEEVLTRAGLEYDVEPDTYRGGIIFASERIGAFFYVHERDVEQAHAALQANRYKPYQP